MLTTLRKPSQMVTVKQAIEMIYTLWNGKSHKELRNYLNDIETEEEYYRLIRLLDNGMMNHYANFLAARAHKRFHSARTFAWKCHALLEKGHPMEVETLIEQYLASSEGLKATAKELNSIRRVYLSALVVLNRIPEAEDMVQEIRANGGQLSADQQTPFLTAANRYTEAEQELEAALALPAEQRGDLAHLALADLLSRRGEHLGAIRVLTEGAKKFSDAPVMKIERVEYLYHLGRFEQLLIELRMLNEQNPYHIRKEYFIYLQAELLYRLERWEEFQNWVATHETLLKGTVFGKKTIDSSKPYRAISLKPIKQKVNYCVPASIAMILGTFGVEKSQDEIAKHIFDKTGSRISDTVRYMESLGFLARYFKGSVNLYKPLIDAGVPVLLDLFVENGSHVQVVKGYDDCIGTLEIQDPNSLHSSYVRYERFDTIYRLKDRLSIVFVRPEQAGFLEMLREEEHTFFKGVFRHLHELEESAEEYIDHMIAFLDTYTEERYASILGLTVIQHDKLEPRLERWRTHLWSVLGTEDHDLNLMIANSYNRYGNREKFQEIIGELKKKTPFTQYLLGVEAYKQDRTEEAIAHLKCSLEMDPYQPNAYAYLANCYSDIKNAEKALKFSQAALWQDSSREFSRTAYANALVAADKREEALEQFQSLANDCPTEAYFAYEVGRCYLVQDVQQAVKWFNHSMELDPLAPYPYLRIAEIQMDEEQWQVAEETLLKGINRNIPSDKTGILWLYMGHTHKARNQFIEAEHAFHHAAERDLDKENLAVVYEVQAIIRQGEWERAERVIQQTLEEDFNLDVAFRAGAMMFDEAETKEQHEAAVCRMEVALRQIQEDILQYVRLYVDAIEYTPAMKQGADLLAELRATTDDVDIYCYEAYLRELLGQFDHAEALLKEALELDVASTFPHYRLGLLYKEMGQTDLAIAHFQTCLELEEDFHSAREELVQLYGVGAQVGRAKIYALELLANYPEACNVRQLATWLNNDERREVRNRLIELEGTVGEEWRKLALSAVIPMSEAIDLLQNEESPKLQFQLAKMYMEDEKYKLAFERLRMLISEYPEDESLYPYWAEAIYKAKKHGAITDIIDEMELAVAEKATICRHLAAAFFPYAKEHLESANGRKTWRNKIRGFMKNLNILVMIEELFEATYEYEPDNPDNYWDYGSFLIEIGEYHDAFKELRKFLRKHDDDNIQFKIGVAALYHGFTAEKPPYIQQAKEKFEIVIRRVPAYYHGWDRLAEAHFYLGEYDQALATYQHAVELDAAMPDGYAGIIMCLDYLNRTEEAVAFANDLEASLRKATIECIDQAMFETNGMVQRLLEKQ
ncbi:tetratricopeptide repeat protein [Sporosarcina sp. FSL K6-1522]|uniref:tetratricopeptide repeat protein n=1 Tax=Sporosarcina sp. FSL K6-1522 TaxID=2921554 RepID=UPI003159BF53